MSPAGSPAEGVPEITAAEVRPDAYLLDVREPDEWTAGHAPAAVHIPLASLPARLHDVPEDRQVVVVCRSGARSARATAYLAASGRDAVNLEGGMQAWAALGRDLRSETPDPPSVI